MGMAAIYHLLISDLAPVVYANHQPSAAVPTEIPATIPGTIVAYSAQLELRSLVLAGVLLLHR